MTITKPLTNNIDRELLDALHARGFKTNMGYKDCGLIPSVLVKAGGYYMGSLFVFFISRCAISIRAEILLFTFGGDQTSEEASTSLTEG